jgi:hypothetical protein
MYSGTDGGGDKRRLVERTTGAHPPAPAGKNHLATDTFFKQPGATAPSFPPPPTHLVVRGHLVPSEHLVLHSVASGSRPSTPRPPPSAGHAAPDRPPPHTRARVARQPGGLGAATPGTAANQSPSPPPPAPRTCTVDVKPSAPRYPSMSSMPYRLLPLDTRLAMLPVMKKMKQPPARRRERRCPFRRAVDPRLARRGAAARPCRCPRQDHQ